MGKKSKRQYRQTKEERERHNTLFEGHKSVDTIPLNPHPSRRRAAPPLECFHGDPASSLTTEHQKRKWLEKATAIAKFGQRYTFQSTLTTLNKISYLFLHLHEHLVDQLFVKIAYASATTEIQEEGDFELARYKTELAIIASYWLEQGKRAFQRAVGQDVVATSEGGKDGISSSSGAAEHAILQVLAAPEIQAGEAEKPLWMQEMEEKLDTVRRGENSLVLYLAKQIPCDCLRNHVSTAKELVQEEKSGSTSFSACEHGKPQMVSAEWNKETEKSICEFAFLAESSPRDFQSLANFFQANTETNFVQFTFAMAARILLDARKYEYAERMCNLGLMAEVMAKKGYEQVKTDVDRLDENDAKMEPYLRDLYINLRKTSDSSGLVTVLSKKVPCNCLDDMKGFLHAEGQNRGEVCDICYQVMPKTELLVCHGCHVELYCSRECQKKDYKKHKKMCKLLASAVDE